MEAGASKDEHPPTASLAAIRPDALPEPLTWRAFLTLAIILVVAVALRWPLLPESYLNVDESMHVQVAKEPTFLAAWQASRVHTHPPLYFLVCHGVWRMGFHEEWMLRIPSLVFGIGALLAAFGWLRELAGNRAAFWTTAFLAVSPPLIDLSAQMRGYTLLLCLLFAGLWCLERAFRVQSAWQMLAGGVALAMAVLTHYAAVWCLAGIGICGLLRCLFQTNSRSVWLTWFAVQAALLGLCVWLKVSHVSTFSGSVTESELWVSTLGPQLASQPLLGVRFAIWRLLQLLAHVAGQAAVPLLLLIPVAATLLYRRRREAGQSPALAIEAVAQVLVPVLFGMLLLVWKIYPLKADRHALWLLPAISLATAACVAALMNRRGLRWIGTLLLMLWLGSLLRTTYPPVITAAPQEFATTVAKFRQQVPRSSVVLVDDATRNVLDYYLARDTLNLGHVVGNPGLAPVRAPVITRRAAEGVAAEQGLVEYTFDGYRVLALPAIFLSESRGFPSRTALERVAGLKPGQELWVCHFGLFDARNSFGLVQQRQLRNVPHTIVWRRGENTLLRLDKTVSDKPSASPLQTLTAH